MNKTSIGLPYDGGAHATHTDESDGFMNGWMDEKNMEERNVKQITTDDRIFKGETLQN